MRYLLVAIVFMLTGCVLSKPYPTYASPPVEKLKLPPGFKISVYSDRVPGARQMVLSDSGTLFVGTIGHGNVYALPDRNHDGVVDEVITVATKLSKPNGVALLDGNLYVAEIPKIIRFNNIEAQMKQSPQSVLVTDAVPKDEWHGNRYIRFGPDGWLYMGIGGPCNVCEKPEDERYASLVRMKPDGSGMEVYGRGIRNTVGFDWHPTTKHIWFTDNGRDWLGDNLPPDELNCAVSKGLNFGWPYRYGMSVPDPEFGYKAKKGTTFTSPAMPLGPHVAALGMRFYTGKMFPERYRNSIFIAEHGSWNRNKKLGYRVTLVTVDGDKATKYETFMDGFLEGDEAWGRPVDICLMPDGSMLVSDDRCGAIYRITYSAPTH